MSHPTDLLATARDDPSRPLVTFYDDATGERVELSAKTFDNWVAKTANLLVDGIGAQPGERVALALPPHWQAVVWLFACWSAGLVAHPVDEDAEIPGDVDVVAVGPDRLAEACRTGAPEVVGLSLHALGAPLADCPPGVLDYAVDVRAYGDTFAGTATPDAPALRLTDGVRTGAELVAEAERSGVPAGARLLTTVRFSTVEAITVGLLAPPAAGGSVIICRNLDESTLERRVSVEHVTLVMGVSPPAGVRSVSSGSAHHVL